MATKLKDRNDAKEVFLECGTCSRTFAHLLNREFGHPKPEEERALNVLAGGILNQGYQCGMLWGSALAVGAASFRRHEDYEDAIAVAVTATRQLMTSFLEQTNALNCKDIIGFDLTSRVGMAKFMIKTTVQGRKNSLCFNLAEDWAPKAVEAARTALGEAVEHGKRSENCAAEIVRLLGGNEEERVMVSGFAGGLGLSGGACGALGAAIWKKMLDWCREHPDQEPPYFNNRTAKKMLDDFKAETGGKMRCSEICGQRFQTLEQHSDYLEKDGCQKLLRVLAQS